ncbi:autoinducer 2 ABC transporter substrate-binding protein [Halalkalibacter alkalisediminis]|uniref:Autoinducer 2 ABC transporter substrate-binding protein n=1 Tax=Halalkalibacter alkalisediminis TaxID=935616 RepID=A0ABV6NIV0_9BACI|nr:autoinducer 2 ABC transporter substrate-binding protein [Halalkalibacter alkalisediminis]
MRLSFLLLYTLLIVSGCTPLGDPSDNQYEVVYKINDIHSTEIEKWRSEEITIALVPKLINIPYFNAVKEGALEAGKDLGVEVIYTGSLLADAKQQIKIIQDLIEQRVDVIAVSVNDPKELAPVLLEAQAQGIIVITWDADAVPEARDFFINMVDPEVLGRHLMDILAWNTSEEGEFAIMTGSMSAANLNEWLDWIKVQQEENYPNMKLVEVVATDDDPNKAYTKAKELLLEYPNLKGIIGNSSVGPPAAAHAVKEQGKQGEVAVVGLSSPNQMNEHLKDGSAQIVTLWSPKKLGYLTVALSKNAVNQTNPYDRQYIPKVGNIHVIDDVVIMGEPIDFTKDNVDQYDF